MKQSQLYFANTLIFLLVFTAVLSAQPAQVGLHFEVGVPQSDFANNTDRNGYGGSINLFHQISQSPLHLGVLVDFMNYGNESRREPFSTTIPDVQVEVNTNNNILIGHLAARLQRPYGVIRPYIGASYGFSYLFTETSIEDLDDHHFEDIASQTNQEDATSSYAFSIGSQILLYQGKTNQNENANSNRFNVLLDLRFRNLIGGEAEYLKEGSIRRENGKVSYDVKHSKTDMRTFQVGVAVSF